jgi:hypothetical protein
MDDMTYDAVIAEVRSRLATTTGQQADTPWSAQVVVAIEGALGHGWVLRSPWDRQELIQRYTDGLTVALPGELDDESHPAFWAAPCPNGCSAHGTIRWHIHAESADITVVGQDAVAVIRHREKETTVRWLEDQPSQKDLIYTAGWAKTILKALGAEEARLPDEVERVVAAHDARIAREEAQWAAFLRGEADPPVVEDDPPHSYEVVTRPE